LLTEGPLRERARERGERVRSECGERATSRKASDFVTNSSLIALDRSLDPCISFLRVGTSAMVRPLLVPELGRGYAMFLQDARLLWREKRLRALDDGFPGDSVEICRDWHLAFRRKLTSKWRSPASSPDEGS